jgi:putative aldouronate transport system substrate-binding protein
VVRGLVSALLLFSLCLVGWAGGKAETGGSTGGKLAAATIKFMLPDEGVQDADAVNAAVEKKLKADGFDFKLSFTYIPYDGYGDRQALVVASGEDYDITWIHWNNFSSNVASGLLSPLNGALNAYGKDLKASTPDFVWQQATIKGNIYAIPRVVPTAHNDWAFSIRADLRKKYGVPEIKTLGDLELYLAALKKNEPNMYPIWVDSIREIWRAWVPDYYFPDTGVYIDLRDPKLTVKNWFATNEYKQVVDKIHEWVQKGYMPNDYGVINNDPQTAFVNGKLGSSDANVMWPTEMVDKLSANVPGGEIEIGFLNPEKPKYIQTAIDNTMGIFSTSKKVNEAVALLNWERASQANYDLFTYGVEGVNYKLVGNKLSYDGIPDNKIYLPPASWIWNDLRFMRYSKNLPDAVITTIKNWDTTAVVSPLLGLSIDKSTFKSVAAAVATIRTQYNVPLERGQLSYDAVKDEMLGKYKQAGIDTEIAEIQKQVDAYMAAKKK